MSDPIVSPILIGCLPQGPGDALHLLALVGFVLAARSLAPTSSGASRARSSEAG